VDKVWDQRASYTRRCWRTMRRPIRITAAKTPPISGESAESIDRAVGCRFHPRCPFAEPLCGNATPKLTAVELQGP